ncbi:ankyrin repeat domain-containing protein [Chitinophaga sp. Cy-1792]|uniref:ankyrin repeat domain-containing protein n=1 Tax=Chitinophaga sp. Cy-1792 TaxID=2608339 RepID=UPI001420228D|nr:hypothetical protein [Chitinophaga sp. Cy-1792]NIG55461.1 hypothetical protein [Chitinophaga sp. Cy-1792]
MSDVNSLAEALKKSNWANAKERINQGEKLGKDLASHDKRWVFDQLARAKEFDILLGLAANGSIETDLYEYESLNNSVFESIFRFASDDDATLDFIQSFFSRIDSINDAVENKTLLELAFNANVPLPVIEILVNAGCDIHYKSNYEENYLYKIVQEYNIKPDTGVKYLEYLIRQGLDPNAGNIVQETPLNLAVGNRKLPYIDLLLENGADPNQPGKNEESAFYYALIHQVCEVPIYQKLAQYAPADFNQANKAGETLICGALRMRKRGTEQEVALIKALVADGADIYQTSLYYQVPKAALDWVAEYPAAMLEGLLETDAIEIDRRDDKGNTLLHKVCAFNVNYQQEDAKQLYKKVKLLLEKGADANITNDQDKSAMDLAAQDNLKAKAVELLLKHKA